MNDNALEILHAKDVFKTFQQAELKVEVLKDINFKVYSKQTHAIMGASGSGKSTLMHLLGGLDDVSSGSIEICNQKVSELNAKQLGDLRNQHLGYIYQFHHLLAEFTALENVAMPLLIRGLNKTEAEARAEQLIQNVQMQHRIEHKPGELSGGERQRIALARALVTEPDCVLADEPTGNLDQKTASQVLEIMLELNERVETALIIVTHDVSIAARMQHQWQLSDFRLEQIS